MSSHPTPNHPPLPEIFYRMIRFSAPALSHTLSSFPSAGAFMGILWRK